MMGIKPQLSQSSKDSPFAADDNMNGNVFTDHSD
jgi:hypothetical protein